MNYTFACWSNLQKASTSIYPKEISGLLLIYVVYYLKIGGFNTASLEITLAGCLATLAATILQQLLTPDIINTHRHSDNYESHIHTLTSKKWISLHFTCRDLEKNRATAKEADSIGYEFDDNFSYSIKDLKTTLGDSGLVSFSTRLIYLRADTSKPYLRLLVLIIGFFGIIMMFWQPIRMMFSIYYP